MAGHVFITLFIAQYLEMTTNECHPNRFIVAVIEKEALLTGPFEIDFSVVVVNDIFYSANKIICFSAEALVFQQYHGTSFTFIIKSKINKSLIQKEKKKKRTSSTVTQQH